MAAGTEGYPLVSKACPCPCLSRFGMAQAAIPFVVVSRTGLLVAFGAAGRPLMVVGGPGPGDARLFMTG